MINNFFNVFIFIILMFAFCFRNVVGGEVIAHIEAEVEDLKDGQEDDGKGVLMQELDQLQMDEFNDFCQGYTK